MKSNRDAPIAILDGRRHLVQGDAVQLLHVEVYGAAVDLDAEPWCAAFVGRLGAAVGQADGPVVQRAGHALAEDDALAQRAALVRAAIEQREHLVFGIAEDGHVATELAREAARAEHGDVVDLADGLPVAHPIAPTGSIWRASTPAFSNSNHGSGSPSSENINLSNSTRRPGASFRMRAFTWSRPTRPM